MEEIRCQKTVKYKEKLSTKLLFLQNDENALTILLHFIVTSTKINIVA